MFKYALLSVTAAVLGLLLTPVVRLLAFRLGAVDEPGGRHVHTQPIPRLGGLALLAAFTGALGVGWLVDQLYTDVFFGYGEGCLWLLAGALLVAAVGVADDIWSLGPVQKLCVQCVAGALTLLGGYGITMVTNPLTGGHIDLGWLGPVVTIAWVVGITNAFNLIDGLDGLAAGVALIVSTTLLVVSVAEGRVDTALLTAALAGAVVGFLYYNFSAASIFLGDSGSLLLGYVLSVLAIESSHKGTTAVVIMVPILALGLPITDTLLAMVRRVLRALRVVRTDPERNEYRFFVVGSASIFRADRDHIHHRLMTLGLTQRRVVLLLYGVCLLFGATAALAVTAHGLQATLMVAGIAGASYVGVRHLGYGEVQIFRRGILLPLFELPLLDRRPLHALIDVGFIMVAYLAAMLVVSGGALGPAARGYFLQSVALVAAVKLMTLVASGLYKRAYRYTNAGDLFGVIKGITAAEVVAAVVVALACGIPDHAGTLLLLDFYLTATCVVGARLLFKLLEALHHESAPADARPVLIYGAGSGGATLLRQLRQNPGLGYQPIGFLDDRVPLWDRRLNGVPVLGGLDKLPDLIRQRHVRDIILADTSMDEDRTQVVAQVCAAGGACLRRFRVAIDPVPEPAPPGNGKGNGNGARLAAWPSQAGAAARLQASLGPDLTAVPPSNAGSPDPKQPALRAALWAKPPLPE